MAHDWLGTFNKSQFERFIAFAKAQLVTVEGRLRHLEFELLRIGTVALSFDTDGTPISYTAAPVDSYVGKLVAAYEVLGGNPLLDLLVRHKSQPVFVLKASEQDSPQLMSSGEVIGAKGLADGWSAEAIRQARGWIDDAMQYRFDRLERKIRRAIDYADQLEDEKAYLTVIQAAGTTTGSLEQIEQAILDLINNPNYRAIYDDAGADPCGFKSYAPFSSYDVVASGDPNIIEREGVSYQRQNTGLVGPGETPEGTT